MNIFLGIAASGGIGIGKAFVIPDEEKRTIPKTHINDDIKPSQWDRFNKALAKVTADIAKSLDECKGDKTQSEIFETYFLMLNDPEFLKDIKKSFDAHSINIEFVLKVKTEEYANKLRNSGNEYLAQRAQDITDVFGRVMNELIDYHPFNIETVPDGCIIVANQLNPSDTIVLSKRKIAGLALTEGGISSHVGILARNFGIPSVFDLHKITKQIKTDETVIIDGVIGEAIVCPDDNTLNEYKIKIAEDLKHKEALRRFRDLSATTKDGTKFKLMANIGTVEEAITAKDEGADGIGLFRTEFLFMSSSDKSTSASSAFSEETQFKAYKAVLETMKGLPVTIRTLDAGGDKLINSPDFTPCEEKNPLLGLRAIRLSLSNPQQLKTQFRALYRASVYGNLKIMLPLITSNEQVEKALEIAAKAREELEAEHIDFNRDVPIGIMIETAAAAITADCLAKRCDFFSIGTNDLTQYTIGVDRENAAVAPLYNEFHLAVLRLINNTIQCAKKAKIQLSVCGEMASRQDSVLVLGGMGVRTLSMSPGQITQVKELLSRFTVKELQAISSKSLNRL